MVCVKAVGVCGSDIHWFSEAGIGDAQLERPLVLGPEFAAVVSVGKVILAGIPSGDQTLFTASVARRKGLTIKLVQRMKHTCPRAIELVSKDLVDVRSLETHRFSLEIPPRPLLLRNFGKKSK